MQNIILPRVDGFMCQGNTFFLERNLLHISIMQATKIIISNNQFFEAGSSAILLKHVYIANVNNNNIIWAGKNDNEPAIKIYGENCFGDNKVLVVVSGNIIEKCYGDGISIVKSAANIDMQGISIIYNLIYLRNTATYLQVRVQGFGTAIMINGNVGSGRIKKSSIGNHSLSSINGAFDGKASTYINTSKQWINTTGTVAINDPCTNIIYFTSSTSTNITDLTIGTDIEDGVELIFVNPSAVNHTIINSTKIKTTSGASITVLPNTIVKFIFMNGFFCQI